MGFCIFNDRYAIRMILKVFRTGDASTSDLLRVGNNYYCATDSARQLKENGLLNEEIDPDRPNRHKWTLTERGRAVAVMLCLCHYVSHGWVSEDGLDELNTRFLEHDEDLRYRECLKE